MEILWVLLEVLRELVNLLREERDLHVRRAGVSVVPGGTFHHRHLFLGSKHECPYPTTPCEIAQVSRNHGMKSSACAELSQKSAA